MDSLRNDGYEGTCLRLEAALALQFFIASTLAIVFIACLVVV